MNCMNPNILSRVRRMVVEGDPDGLPAWSRKSGFYFMRSRLTALCYICTCSILSNQHTQIFIQYFHVADSMCW